MSSWAKIKKQYLKMADLDAHDLKDAINEIQDKGLACEIKSLLGFKEKANSFFAEPIPIKIIDTQTVVNLNSDPLYSDFSKKYTAEKIIGKGGTSTVLRAKGNKCDRVYAIKLLNFGLKSSRYKELLEKEYRILQNINSKTVPRAFDIGFVEENRPFLALELVNGDDLWQYSKLDQISLNDKVDFFKSLCLSVKDIHNNRIVHMDIKPANIFHYLQHKADKVKIIDFGSAHFIGERVENPMVSPFFSCPEIKTGCIAKTHFDLYSLGIVFLFLLSDGSLELTKRALENLNPSLGTEGTTAVSSQIAYVVNKLVKHNFECHYHEVASLINDLTEIQKLLKI